MLKINDKVNFEATGYANAEAVGTIDGYTVFVPQMIVGEKALVKINYVKRNVAYATVEELLVPSRDRVKPKCKYYGKCGGCSLMHAAYCEQLKFKQNKVKNNLLKLGKIDFDIQPCFPSSKVFGYRNKLSLPVGGRVGNVKIGMYRKGSHTIVDVEDCLLGGDWAKKLVKLFRQYMNDESIEPYDEKTFKGQVRHLVARFVCNQLLVMIVTNGACKLNTESLQKALQKEFSAFGLFVNENHGKNNVIVGDKTHHVCGIECISGEHCGVKFHLHPESFFQVNDEVKDALYADVKRLLDVSDTEVLVDCFSGIGILTTVLCSDKYATYGVEIEPSSVADADANARLNRSPNLINLLGDANVFLPKITAEHKGKRLSLVVDPPRKGLGQGICNTIIDAEFDNVVYVSCDSATLARDLSYLSAKYAVKSVRPYDMFPQTDQVETVVLLSRFG